MQKVNMAHLRHGSSSVAIFDAKSTVGDNAGLLYQLTQKAIASGLRVDSSALVYSSGGKIRFEGDPSLVRYLAKGWYPQWTHELSI
ncbi:hypothetical protein [Shewanella decolorationis]|uniref:Uncharacterized protein n=2 Tax=Shewanella decolorationis TaxID=256839 RepID=A0A5B8QY71_9GAMM|nr:hypothetical protein [Shewanella decolorationis]ESE42764.1 hypothetical protein SHD_0617 [Shewanella decolorationis S12]QDZ90919.1 hypothetical protein D0436_10795 [Shewanella decolorationis]GLR31546.1 hypothetical protein GCM10007922_11030 [Shewanella decolorationis]